MEDKPARKKRETKSKSPKKRREIKNKSKPKEDRVRSEKQFALCHEYLKTLCLRKAAENVGYTYGYARNVMTKPSIKKYMEELLEVDKMKAKMILNRSLEELQKIAFAADVSKDGDPECFRRIYQIGGKEGENDLDRVEQYDKTGALKFLVKYYHDASHKEDPDDDKQSGHSRVLGMVQRASKILGGTG